MGKKLKYLDLRREAEINVLMLQRSVAGNSEDNGASSQTQEIRPHANLVFVHGDRVLVMGS